MIAIIPAQGGYKDLPNKNIKYLAGKPLISYTIDAAKKSKYINRIIVSTDSEEIKRIAEDEGAEVPFLRPKNLTGANVLAVEVYLYTIEQLNLEEETIVSEFIALQPTSPLRTSEDIDLAIELFREKKADSVISFRETNDSPTESKMILNDKIINFYDKSAADKEVKEHDKTYIPNGAIFIFNYQFLKDHGLNYSEKSFPYIMPIERSIHLDTLLDFDYVEFLILKNKNSLSSLQDIDQYKVSSTLSIRGSIKKLDDTGIGFIAIIDQSNKVQGVVTDGDFRRAVLTGISLDKPISEISNKNFISVSDGYTKEELENVFLNDIAQVPVIHHGELKGIILRQNLPNISDENIGRPKMNIPVVIMAGGKGTRLEPFTHIMPKPLVPIGNKPIIEIIMDRFAEFGVSEFYISVNYKANMIKAYFEEKPIANNIHYITEDFPLGTAGALKSVKGIINSTFFVSNCDIIIKSDYSKILSFHKAGKYDLTVVASMHHHTIPYGVCYVENGGDLKEISEKPEYDYLINTGMYVLEPSVLDYIPENTFYHITHLIEALKKNNLSVGVYPVYEKAWIDIGQWEEYKNSIKYLQ